MSRLLAVAAAIAMLTVLVTAEDAWADDTRDSERDLLVTFDNRSAQRGGGSVRAPYRHRPRYAVSSQARARASEIAADYQLSEIDRWPIRSLAVYCVVYRAADSEDRDRLIERLARDSRVESVQPLHTFVTGTSEDGYDDAYAGMQSGLVAMSVSAAHRYALGSGVRVLVIDSGADTDHEDLLGRFRRVEHFAERAESGEGVAHGTAVASVIGANANNEVGMVGIAPESELDLFAACWGGAGGGPAVCDSFSLARALDAALSNPPDVLNLSLTGPHDELLRRLLVELHEAGVIIVAAAAFDVDESNHFPASVESVIGVSVSRSGPVLASLDEPADPATSFVFAPGQQILVAIPDDDYGFRSGSSLAAAHVSGVVALLLSAAPDLGAAEILGALQRSQRATEGDVLSIDACLALSLADARYACH